MNQKFVVGKVDDEPAFCHHCNTVFTEGCIVNVDLDKALMLCETCFLHNKKEKLQNLILDNPKVEMHEEGKDIFTFSYCGGLIKAHADVDCNVTYERAPGVALYWDQELAIKAQMFDLWRAAKYSDFIIRRRK